MQTKFGKQGNCLAACVSSLIDLDINEVPNVEVLFDIENAVTLQDGEPLWGVVLFEFLKSKGYTWRQATEEEIKNPPKGKPFLCIGESRNIPGVNHAVIYQDGKLFHDPNPFVKGISKIISLQVIEKV